jgi:hypothetical protein
MPWTRRLLVRCEHRPAGLLGLVRLAPATSLLKRSPDSLQMVGRKHT